MKRSLKIIAGTAVWLCAGLAVFPGVQKSLSFNPNWTKDLSQHLVGARRTVHLELDPPQLLQVGDPVFEQSLSPSFPIGRIVAINGQAYDFRQLVLAKTAELELYSMAYPIAPTDRITVHSTPTSLAWVIQTMFPPEMQQRLTQLILQAYTQHQADISRQLSPVVNEILVKSAEVIRRDLQQAIRSRSEQFEKIAERYRDTFVDKELIPLMQTEIWPVARERLTPLMERIGLRLWQEASLFRLTWRYLYDVSPLPQRDLTRKEFQRFLAEQVTPIVVEYGPEFNVIQQQLIRELSTNAKVQAVITTGLQQLAQDVEIQSLTWDIAQETLVQNPRLRAVWQEVWNSPEATVALMNTSQKLEPTIAAIGETLFGNPNTAITPEFSRVIRNRVLLKDSRWLLVCRGAEPVEATVKADSGDVTMTKRVWPGDPQSPNPFHVPARPRN